MPGQFPQRWFSHFAFSFPEVKSLLGGTRPPWDTPSLAFCHGHPEHNLFGINSFAPDSQANPAHIFRSNARDELGYSPQEPFEEGLRRALVLYSHREGVTLFYSISGSRDPVNMDVNTAFHCVSRRGHRPR